MPFYHDTPTHSTGATMASTLSDATFHFDAPDVDWQYKFTFYFSAAASTTSLEGTTLTDLDFTYPTSSHNTDLTATVLSDSVFTYDSPTGSTDMEGSTLTDIDFTFDDPTHDLT